MSRSERIVNAADFKEAVHIFKEILIEENDRIERSRNKMRNIAMGITPEAPHIEYEFTEPREIKTAPWADNRFKSALCSQMQSIVYRLDTLPVFDYVPAVALCGISHSGYIAQLFGTKLSVHDGGCLTIDKHAIESVDEIPNLKMPNLQQDDNFLLITDNAKFLAEHLQGCVDIAYPQLQGPSTNSLRIMSENEGLIATITEPELMRDLGLMITKVMVEVIEGLFAAAGSSKFFRPRARFYQPDNVKGLMVDDWISTMSEESYVEIYRDSFAYMNEKLGDIFLHTCGPILHATNTINNLPGMKMMEAAFLRNQAKTVEDLFVAKKELSNIAFCSFGLPFGEIIDKGQQLTRDNIVELSQGGRFAMQAYGTVDYGKELAKSFIL